MCRIIREVFAGGKSSLPVTANVLRAQRGRRDGWQHGGQQNHPALVAQALLLACADVWIASSVATPSFAEHQHLQNPKNFAVLIFHTSLSESTVCATANGGDARNKHGQ
jgi:hypothetical protein